VGGRRIAIVGVGGWLRRLFSPASAEAEAVEREEYGTDDAGRADLENPRHSMRTYASFEATEAVEADLGELDAPPDPDP
jgi:hypothetical protein